MFCPICGTEVEIKGSPHFTGECPRKACGTRLFGEMFLSRVSMMHLYAVSPILPFAEDPNFSLALSEQPGKEDT